MPPKASKVSKVPAVSSVPSVPSKRKSPGETEEGNAEEIEKSKKQKETQETSAPSVPSSSSSLPPSSPPVVFDDLANDPIPIGGGDDAEEENDAKAPPPPLPSEWPSQGLCDKLHRIPPSPFHCEVLTFGSGDCSQLGFGHEESQREKKFPTALTAPPLATAHCVFSAAGALHNAVVTSEGTVFTWGCNDDGALGRGGDEFFAAAVDGISRSAGGGDKKNHKKGKGKGAAISTEIPPTAPIALRVAMVSCGASHSLALTDCGRVFGWGLYRENAGVIGFSPNVKKAKIPHWIDSLKTPTVFIAAGEEHDVVLQSNGDVYTWGDIGIGQRASARNSSQQKNEKLTPRRVVFKSLRGKAKATNFISVWAGGHSSFAVNKDGKVWAWGPNNYNQLGLKNTLSGKLEDLIVKQIPELIEGIPPITKVAGGSHHSLFLTTDGKVLSVGRGHSGRLGHGDEAHHTEPKVIEQLDFSLRGLSDSVIDIACGEAHSLVATKKGKLFGFGYGDLLQLGNGEDTDQCNPTEAKGKALREGRRVFQVAAGSQHSMALAFKDPQWEKEIQKEKENQNTQNNTTNKQPKPQAQTFAFSFQIPTQKAAPSSSPSPSPSPSPPPSFTISPPSHLPAPSPTSSSSPRLDVTQMNQQDEEAAAADLPSDSDDDGDDDLPSVTEEDQIMADAAEKQLKQMEH